MFFTWKASSILILSRQKKKGVDLNKYKVEVSNDFLEYTFYSVGPKGSIRKVVYFTPVILPDLEYYNLGFGDWDNEMEIINDLIISNNQDTEKVLASVADIIISFTDHYPESLIYVEASTKPRLRLYQ